MRDFRDFKVWGKAHSLTLEIYRCTSSFPKIEMYGLTSQLRRASSSIPANIAEGCGRGGSKELCRFLQIGMGSASELEYHILLAHDLTYLPDLIYDPLQKRVVEVKQMLTALHRRIQGD
jgi:four helix bundle protein